MMCWEDNYSLTKIYNIVFPLLRNFFFIMFLIPLDIQGTVRLAQTV